MKTLTSITLLFLALTIIFAGCAKESVDSAADVLNIPQQAKDAFKTDFSDAKGAKWHKTGEYFAATYEENDLERVVYYDAKGQEVAREMELNPSELMPAITSYIAQHYPSHTIAEAELSKVPKGTFYEVELEAGDEEVELIFDEQGSFIKAEGEEDEEEEEEDEDENEKEIDPSELPEVIKASIEAQYPGAELVEADEVTQEDGSLTYDVEIKFEDKITEVMYDAQGTFLGIEADDDDDDEEQEE